MAIGLVAIGLPQLLADDYVLLFGAKRESSQLARLIRFEVAG